MQGSTPLSTGEILIPSGLAGAVATVVSGRLYNRVGPRILAALGFALLAVGTFAFSRLDVTTTSTSLQPWLIMRGFGFGLTNIPAQTLALSVVSNRAMARASSLSNVTRQVFGAVGISALTAYFLQQATSHGQPLFTQLLTSSSFPAVAQYQQFLASPAAQHCLDNGGANVPPAIYAICQQAATSSLNDTFLIAAIGCAVCIVIALLVGRDPAVQAAKTAAANGETAGTPQPVLVGE